MSNPTPVTPIIAPLTFKEIEDPSWQGVEVRTSIIYTCAERVSDFALTMQGREQTLQHVKANLRASFLDRLYGPLMPRVRDLRSFALKNAGDSDAAIINRLYSEITTLVS